MNAVLQMSQQHREEIREQHQETTTALLGQVESLKRQMLPLADGHTPEEIREGRALAEHNKTRLNHLLEKHARLKTLATELHQLDGKRWGKAGKRRRKTRAEMDRAISEVQAVKVIHTLRANREKNGYERANREKNNGQIERKNLCG